MSDYLNENTENTQYGSSNIINLLNNNYLTSISEPIITLIPTYTTLTYPHTTPIPTPSSLLQYMIPYPTPTVPAHNFNFQLPIPTVNPNFPNWVPTPAASLNFQIPIPTQPYSFGHTGDWCTNSYINNARFLLLNSKFTFTDNEFNIKIFLMSEKEDNFFQRYYDIKYKNLHYKTILKINQDTFEPVYNKKFYKIIELIEDLQKLNKYYSNICRSILKKDMFIGRTINSKFEIEI
jgi:hypothetical protein